ncbi:MAG: hypothetical protein A4E49_01353 [Methanosaeta sp. PtaU1.Bin112]|nr:MAG: hypothetical protein A4E49_01353 [Methanosaeta sp. PtaU1.Bin112]
MTNKLSLILFSLLFIFSGIALSQGDEDGWYLQGDPVINKDEEIDLPPCYTERTVTVSDGKGHGSVKRSEECFKEASGSYESDVTWTVPPEFMKPGMMINFTMTCTSQLADNSTNGLIGYEGRTILQARCTNPEGKSTGSFIVPNGKQDDEMAIYASFVVISGLHGDVAYNYRYLKAGDIDSGSSETLDPEPKSKESQVIYNSWNTGSVGGNTTCSPFFTIDEPQMITYIDTYHWNNGAVAPGGTIGLIDGYGTQYGPWKVETSLDRSEVPKGYWIAHPNEIIPAGTYILEDSNPATWSRNSESPCGFARVEGYAAPDSPEKVEASASETVIKAPGSSEESNDKIKSPAKTELADGRIESEKILDGPEAEDKERSKNSIFEMISSSIKTSTAASVRKPTSIDRGTDKDTSSDKITSLDRSAKPLVIFSQAATGDFECNPQNFAGFYYDLNSNTGTEVMTATLTNGMLSGSYPYGLVYQTTVQQNDFAFRDWGYYSVIGLLGEKYFAGYLDTAGGIEERLFRESGDADVLSANRLLRVLIDDDHEKTITTATPLELEDGYTLAIDSIDASGNTVTLVLSKDGKRLFTKKIFPSRDGATMAEKTFIYRKSFGNLRDVIIAAVHFKNAFRGADQDLATVDGIWQLSDEALDVSVGTSLGKMTIQTVTDDGIVMNNEGSDLSLSRNKDISLMPGFGIRTADADSLRYCIYREITGPGTFRLRGAVADDSYSWTADSFAGFYYDLDDGIKTELLRTSVIDGALEQPDGITYITNAQKANFEFEEWGSYKVIGFLGERCLAEYVSGEESPAKSSSNLESAKGLLFDKSTDKSALAEKQLLKILADDDAEKTITTNSPLNLEEGYELSIKSISSDGNNVYLELSRNGEVVHSAIMHPSYGAAATAENTYIYKGDSGELKNVVLIAVHFKNAFRGADQNLATVDGIWQISKSPISVKEMTSFGKLTISDITGSQITMSNRENPIKLSRNKYVSLAGDIYLQTADSDLLRYCIVREIEID